VLAIAGTIAAAQVQQPAENPYYPKVLAELRLARELLQHAPGERALDLKTQALGEIDAAMSELERATVKDGKSRDDRVYADSRGKGLDPYYQAIKALARAQGEMVNNQSDPAKRDWRLYVAGHIARARQLSARAIETLSSPGA
jgi:hypothetical protein